MFTDDVPFLAESLSRDLSKTSALDFEKTQAQVPNFATDQSQFAKKTHGVGLGWRFDRIAGQRCNLVKYSADFGFQRE